MYFKSAYVEQPHKMCWPYADECSFQETGSFTKIGVTAAIISSDSVVGD